MSKSGRNQRKRAIWCPFFSIVLGSKKSTEVLFYCVDSPQFFASVKTVGVDCIVLSAARRNEWKLKEFSSTQEQTSLTISLEREKEDFFYKSEEEISRETFGDVSNSLVFVVTSMVH
ncbi:uncharacterized protein LOC111639418 [Centruroides sculpturatus]|uniref:uncharacterized protein LOC111639418 n=1 Tax=Centruroides sculpturatus TaxID=218467 RepID=UPI000C6CBD60|nr:uncharacterized protein LOC111639418 [Centruroides sculpturatus]